MTDARLRRRAPGRPAAGMTRLLTALALVGAAASLAAPAAMAQQPHWFYDQFAAYDRRAYEAPVPPGEFAPPGFFRHPWKPFGRTGNYRRSHRDATGRFVYDRDVYGDGAYANDDYANTPQRYRDGDVPPRYYDLKQRTERLRNDPRYVEVPLPRRKPAFAGSPDEAPGDVASLDAPLTAAPGGHRADRATREPSPDWRSPDQEDLRAAVRPEPRPLTTGSIQPAPSTTGTADRLSQRRVATLDPDAARGKQVIVDGIPKTAHGTYVPSANRLMSCDRAATIVADFGFTDVRASECIGNVYSFEATRDGDRFKVRLSALNGELTEIRRQ